MSLPLVAAGLPVADARADEAYDAMVSQAEAEGREVVSRHLTLGLGTTNVVGYRLERGSSALEASAVMTLVHLRPGELFQPRAGVRFNWMVFGNATGERSIYRGAGLGYHLTLDMESEIPYSKWRSHPDLHLFTGYEFDRQSRIKWFVQAELDISGERMLHADSEAFPASLLFSVGGAWQFAGERP
jgi:hypothetical protein